MWKNQVCIIYLKKCGIFIRIRQKIKSERDTFYFEDFIEVLLILERTIYYCKISFYESNREILSIEKYFL